METSVAHTGWPWRRVVIFGLIIFGLQASLLYKLSVKEAPPVRENVETATFAFGVPTPQGDASPIVPLNDPTIFALPHPKGFSGPALFAPASTPYSPFQASAPSAFIDGRRRNAASRDDDQALGPAYTVLNREIKAAPRPSTVRVPSRRLRESQAVVAGNLIGRQLVNPKPVPVQRHTDILSNTVVQVSVDARGVPLTARLMTSSGSEAVDAQALSYAREARFTPAPAQRAVPERGFVPEPKLDFLQTNHELTSGELVFRWLTLPPGVTNPPAAQ